MSEKLAVVMPVYNERDAIGAVLDKWVHALDALGIDYEIRPYNDGSHDDSLEIMRLSAQRLGDGRINVRDKSNGGHGNTILTGYREAAADGLTGYSKLIPTTRWDRRNLKSCGHVVMNMTFSQEGGMGADRSCRERLSVSSRGFA